MTLTVTAKGLDGLLRYFERFPATANQAASFAVNDAADFALALARRKVGEDLALKPSYLKDPDKIRILKRASAGSPEAILRANFRPISLARFATQAPKFGRQTGGVTVRVRARGGSTHLKRAFFVPLKRGKTLDVSGGVFNVGLAVRLKPGEKIRNKRVIVQKGQFNLLYGPSLDQALRQMLPSMHPLVADKLRVEFLRHFKRLTKNG